MIGASLDVLTLDEVGFTGEMVESGRTFDDNARIKVRALVDFLRKAAGYRAEPALLAVADDSGLEVDCLGGAPGVCSARYAGEPCDDQANLIKLLQALEHVPSSRRGAQFRCVLAVAWVKSGKIRTFEGICRGRIGLEPRGTGGFGYDPVFFPSRSRQTFAEISSEEKNRRSHRARAMRRFTSWLKRLRAKADRNPDRSE